MNTLQLAIADNLAIITLDRGRSNPINHQMVKELKSCMNDLASDANVGGVILTGKEGFFSSGIDLIEVYDYDKEQIRNFWIDFLALQTSLASFKKPLVAAISGHSPAGGCVMAICCDYRIMVGGRFIIGLNEVPVGIIVPGSIFHLYSFWIGQRRAYQYLLEGRLLNVNEAVEIGLVDEMCTPESLSSLAEKKARTYMKLNQVTWSESKLNLRKELLSQLDQDQSATLDQMLEQWWAPETRKGLQLMIENLTTKKN